MFSYRKGFQHYLVILIIILASIYLAWVLGNLFVKNITVSEPSNKRYRIYQNSLAIKPIPIYILQLGVYNDNRTAQIDAEKFSIKGVVTYLTNHESYRLITDIYIEEKYLNQKKEELEKKGLSAIIVKELISNNRQYLSVSEKENMHNQINNLFLEYSQWLKANELYWVEKEKVINSSVMEGPILNKKEEILNEYSQLDILLKALILDIKEEKLKDKLKNLGKVSKEYIDNFTNIDNGIDSKRFNLAKGQLLACWDHFQYLYEYIGDDRKVVNYFN